MSNRFQRSLFSLGCIACVLGISLFSSADDAERKLKSKVNPQYPELARRMNISGSVRLELLVNPNGQVKSVKTIGGHPLLVDAAQTAVKQWRYEPGPEGTEVVEIRFKPMK